ncbi:hypothetical protein JAAARDRAFT_195349 [Jaapia argillacea MUCL 33604]|uniref:Uncharacterized protein n=1 Tax=Jaapia argillacea MUCL 33604 TaxID=933084 RepID=A0A067PXZ2_9AGAM|nr:hypothetical protein JAAARDRAFT_195349 [Jaapia argillacea MUCL 33604]
MDPSQDLLVLVELAEYEPKGEQHPLGPALGYFDHDLVGLASILRRIQIVICGDYVGIIFVYLVDSYLYDEFCIWAWKEGDLLMCLQLGRKARIQSFTFLNETQVLLANIFADGDGWKSMIS